MRPCHCQLEHHRHVPASLLLVDLLSRDRCVWNGWKLCQAWQVQMLYNKDNDAAVCGVVCAAVTLDCCHRYQTTLVVLLPQTCWNACIRCALTFDDVLCSCRAAVAVCAVDPSRGTTVVRPQDRNVHTIYLQRLLLVAVRLLTSLRSTCCYNIT